MAALIFSACEIDRGLGAGGLGPSGISRDFVPVTRVIFTGSAATTAGRDIILSGIVQPANATYQTILWSVAAGEGASIVEGNTLRVMERGTVIIRASIAQGVTVSQDYTQDFEIDVKFSSLIESVLAEIEADSTYSGSIDDPVPIKRDLNLEESSIQWTELLTAIKEAGKFVNIDLSGSAMGSNNSGEKVFDTGSANTGEAYIVSLTLPDAASTMTAGELQDYSFKRFTALKEVHGAGITAVANYSFGETYKENRLIVADFPEAQTIGYSAFEDCKVLTTVSFPNVSDITIRAFKNCVLLSEVTAPNITFIHSEAFAYCASLGSVDFLKTRSIGTSAFLQSGITAANFPQAYFISQGAFANCSNLVSVDFRAASNIGASPFTGCVSLSSITIGADCVVWMSPGVSTDSFIDAYNNDNDKAAGVYTRTDNGGSYAWSRADITP
jgi:hypothetical protein